MPVVSSSSRALVGLALTMALATGCSPEKPRSTEAAASPKAGLDGAQLASASAAPKANYAVANELGKVPVLEYHRFGTKEERWTRTFDHFRQDLTWLYNNDYVLVNMRDVAERQIDIPAGKKPVVLTFDDSTLEQFRYLTDKAGKVKRDAAGKAMIDPDCAVGILDAFYEKHPDFGRGGTFYVLPSGFEQDGVIGEKFRYLVETGREIGNHTWAHDSMAHMSAAQVHKAVGKLQAFVRQELGKPYTIETLALPYGIGPKDATAYKAVMSGGTGTDGYHHLALLLVGANPNVSPYDKAYKPGAVARIQAIDSEFHNWFNRKAGSTAKGREPWVPYVSDGDPAKVTFPVALKAHFDAQALAAGQTANPYDPKAAADVAAEADSKKAESQAASGQASASEAAEPVSTATRVHPGYKEELPDGALYDGGKITYTVKPGDSVEAIAYHLIRFTDYYTYPELTKAIRKANGIDRPLQIGQKLEIPGVRQKPPHATMQPVPRTFNAKGIYVTGTTAGSELVWKLVKDLKAQGGNTVVFDAKDMNGVLSYDSQVPLAKTVKAYQGGMITDMDKFLERMHEEGIHTVARLALFHDAHLARTKPELALRSRRTGRPWLDHGKLLWVDPSLKRVQDYELALAKELIAHGVDEIQFDYVRFPAQDDTADIAWSSMAHEKAKHDVITAWVKRAYAEIKPTGALLSADVYGVVAWDQGIDVKITGQKLEELGQHLDVLSPMLYPSHFYGTFDGKAYPPDHPAYFVGEGVKRVAKKTAGSGVVIRPWIQAFPYRIRHYGPDYVTVQLKAGNEAGGGGWLLWNAENDYRVGLAGVSKLVKGGGAGQ